MLLRLAWRNLGRNRRRTALSAGSAAFATAIVLVTLALARGSHERWIEQVVRLYPGHVEVSLEGYREYRTLDYGMRLPPALAARLDALREAEGWAPRLEAWGLIMRDEEGASGRAVQLLGIDAVRENRLTRLVAGVREGRLGGPDTNEIVLGERLASALAVDPGDLVIVMAPDRYGSQSAERFRVSGILSVGDPELDRHSALVRLPQLQAFLELEQSVSHVVLFAPDGEQLEPLTSQLLRMFPAGEYELVAWPELIPDMVQFMELDDIGAWLTTGVLIIVVGFGLLNTLLMSVLERIPEFGVLRALGLRPRALFRLVFLESILLSLIGVAIGIALSAPLLLWVEGHPVVIGGEGMARAVELWGLDPKIVFDLTWTQIGVTAGTLVGVSLLAAWPPALRAARGHPLDALRALG